MYDVEESPLFWESLDELDALGQPDPIAKAASILTSWALYEPKRAAADENGIRVLKLPPAYLEGDLTPPLRLAYSVVDGVRPNGMLGVVVLFHIQVYNDAEHVAGATVPPFRP